MLPDESCIRPKLVRWGLFGDPSIGRAGNQFRPALFVLAIARMIDLLTNPDAKKNAKHANDRINVLIQIDRFDRPEQERFRQFTSTALKLLLVHSLIPGKTHFCG
jgi:hypothetical protein